MDGYHWYGAEGDAGNAGLSCAAMVPLAGSAATATKWGIKYGDEVVALSDDAVAKIDEAVGAACSFSGDTTVATPDGEKAISELEVGDTVLAWDEETGKLGSFEVTATFSHEDTVIEYLVIDGERLVTTPEHPFYTRERGWVAAGDLQKGEHVQKADGSWGVVESLRLVERKQRMYNLTVDTAHTYFVGDGGWLVHNSCGPVIHPGVGNKLPGSNYVWGKGDINWIGQGKTVRDATDEAFRQLGMSRDQFEITAWGKDKWGKSFPVEWTGPGGATVSIDLPHPSYSQAPDFAPHVGYRFPKGDPRGYRGGHIFLDDVTYNR